MATRAVELFAQIRAEVVARLIERRAALQLGLAAQSPETARAEIDSVLDRMIGYLAGPDDARDRRFIARWVAYHLGEGFSPENLVHSIVTTGDLLTQVARRRLPAGGETSALVRDLARMIHAMARMVVDELGDELGRLDAVGEVGSAARRST